MGRGPSRPAGGLRSLTRGQTKILRDYGRTVLWSRVSEWAIGGVYVGSVAISQS